MCQRGHGQISNQPVGIAESLDQRRRSRAAVKPSQCFDGTATDEGVFIIQQVLQSWHFVFSHPIPPQPGRLPAHRDGRIGLQPFQKIRGQRIETRRQNPDCAQPLAQWERGVQRDAPHRPPKPSAERPLNFLLPQTAPFRCRLGQGENIVDQLFDVLRHGRPRRNDLWRGKQGGQVPCSPDFI